MTCTELTHHHLADPRPYNLTTKENTGFNTPLAGQFFQPNKPAEASDLNINIKNGVATLSGKSISNANSNRVEYLISKISEVDVVINLITTDPLEVGLQK